MKKYQSKMSNRFQSEETSIEVYQKRPAIRLLIFTKSKIESAKKALETAAKLSTNMYSKWLLWREGLSEFSER